MEDERSYRGEYPEPDFGTDELESEPEAEYEASGEDAWEQQELFRAHVDAFAREEADTLQAVADAQESARDQKDITWMQYLREKRAYISAFVLASLISGGAAKMKQSELEYAASQHEMTQMLDESSKEEASTFLEESEVRSLAETNVHNALNRLDEWKEAPYAKDILMEFAIDDPQSMSGHLLKLEGNPYLSELVEEMVLADPAYTSMQAEREPDPDYMFEEYRFAKNQFADAIENSPNPKVELVRETAEHELGRGERRRILEISSFVIANELSLEEALEVVSDDHKFWDAQVEVMLTGSPQEREDAKEYLSSEAEQRIKYMDFHKGEAGRFESVAGASVNELYTTILFGAEMGRPSSTQPLFDMMHRDMKAQGLTPSAFLEQVGGYEYHKFVKLASENRRFDDFLKLAQTQEEKEQLVDGLLGSLDQGETAEKLASAAQVIVTERNAEVRGMLRAQLESEWNQAVEEGSREAQVAYGLLSDLYGKEATWLGERANEFSIELENELEVSDLLNERGESVQAFYFYNDTDGHWSFHHFLNEFRSQGGWEIKDQGTFVEVSKEQDGRTVIMYANKPMAGLEGEFRDMVDSYDGMLEALKYMEASRSIADLPKDAWESGPPNGVEDMATFMAENDRSPSMQVHRGHVYYNGYTMEQLDPNTKLYFDGSCGGGADMDTALRSLPDAQVLYNTQEGKSGINDAIVASINKRILAGKDIVWEDVRREAYKAMGSEYEEDEVQDAQFAFHQYVFPNELDAKAVMVEAAYKRLIDSTDV